MITTAQTLGPERMRELIGSFVELAIRERRT